MRYGYLLIAPQPALEARLWAGSFQQYSCQRALRVQALEYRAVVPVHSLFSGDLATASVGLLLTYQQPIRLLFAVKNPALPPALACRATSRLGSWLAQNLLKPSHAYPQAFHTSVEQRLNL